MDPKKVAEYDQASKLLVESIPPMAYALYESFIKEGFTEAQSFELCKTWLISTLNPGIKV
jgi:hypothetical protein